MVSTKYLARCPRCNQGSPETIKNLVLECERWRSRREAFLSGDIKRAHQTIGAAPREEKCTALSLLFGGNSDSAQLED